MSYWDFVRGPASVRLLTEFGQERGLDAQALLARTKLSASDLSNPDLEVSAAQELAVVRNLLRHIKFVPGLGSQIGQCYHFSSYGIWGYALISSATASDALALALRFMPLTYAFTKITQHQDGSSCVLRFEALDVPPDLRQVLVERDMTAAAVLLREVAGSAFVCSRFAFKASGQWPQRDVAAIEKLIGVKPAYGAQENCLAFDSAYLTHPLPQAEPATLAMCQQMCTQLLQRRQKRFGAADMTRQYLSVLPAGEVPALADLARLMNTSERTMKRRLKDEETSFRALLQESRSNSAKEMLKDPSLSLTHIAEVLGFSDLSSFSQAFKRWHGVAPRKYRDAAASGYLNAALRSDA